MIIILNTNMSGLLKGLLRIATFGYLGSSNPQPVAEQPSEPVNNNPEPVIEQPVIESSTTSDASENFNAEYFWSSGRRIKNFSYQQLNKTEQEIINDIVDYLNEEYDAEYEPTEARHINLNHRLDTLDFKFKGCEELFHVLKDEKGVWDVLEDEDFWQTYGSHEDIEDVYIPPN